MSAIIRPIIRSDIQPVAAIVEYGSSKTYVHETGLSCAFRQWRAVSHCRFLHGYALKVSLTFSTYKLDSRNWVVDFGGLSFVKQFLIDHFDHKTIVAEDDPELETFKQLHEKGLLELVIMPHVGCEKFAEFIFNFVHREIKKHSHHATLRRVEVHEHGANSASVSL